MDRTNTRTLDASWTVKRRRALAGGGVGRGVHLALCEQQERRVHGVDGGHGARVEGHGVGLRGVLGQEAGGEGQQRDQAETEQGQPGDHTRLDGHRREDAPMVTPEPGDQRETERERAETGQRAAQGLVERGVAQIRGDRDIDDEQRHRDGVYPVGQSDQTCRTGECSGVRVAAAGSVMPMTVGRRAQARWWRTGASAYGPECRVVGGCPGSAQSVCIPTHSDCINVR